MRWHEERNLNMDTFGEASLQRGRGRGRGRGGRGNWRGRGNYRGRGGNWRVVIATEEETAITILNQNGRKI